ncbi:hypothetical protein DL96DRAFT_1594433 [Flagelloscypha sp. PMI_526]|nr:hypothetical protein DL96DRAFT_1594433 [Flagelloscypha sp. PMI_526]
MTVLLVYRYNGSPYANKIDTILQLKGLSHLAVQVSPVPPRGQLGALGVGYRRIPVLVLDRDIYCDTTLIAATLDALQPSPPLFPLRKDAPGSPSDKQVIETWSKHYIEGIIFPVAANLLPWEHMPPAIVKDRSKLAGVPMDPQVMAAMRPLFLSKLNTSLHVFESQLSDNRSWVLNTNSPSLADIALHMIVSWLLSPAFKHLKATPPIPPSEFPRLTEWLDRFNAILRPAEGQAQKLQTAITGDEALKRLSNEVPLIAPASDASRVDVADAQRLGIQFGDLVGVAPEDTGRDGITTGRLVVLNPSEVVIEIQGGDPGVGLMRCHFPRGGYRIKKAKVEQGKL